MSHLNIKKPRVNVSVTRSNRRKVEDSSPVGSAAMSLREYYPTDRGAFI
jgi:hypothetical protein